MSIYVNDAEISEDAVFTEMQYHSAESQDEAYTAAAQALIIRTLLEEEADRQDIKIEGKSEEASDALLMQLVEKEVAAPAATSDICSRYYDQNKERFKAQGTSDLYVPFEQVEDKIRDYLHTRSIREGIRSYILALAENARIKGFDLAASM